MIADFFEMDGWDTYYLGASTPAQSVASAVHERGAHLLAISATIPFNLGAVTELVGEMRSSPSTRGVPILVGGRPFNLAKDLWKTLTRSSHTWSG